MNEEASEHHSHGKPAGDSHHARNSPISVSHVALRNPYRTERIVVRSSYGVAWISATPMQDGRRDHREELHHDGDDRCEWLLLGIVPAGAPSDESESEDEGIRRIEDLVPGIRPGDFCLMVQGDSMIEAGLSPGQYVVIRPEMPRRNGEICAVWIDGLGATLKKVYAERDMVRLVPANPNYAEMCYPADQVRIQGVLVASLAITRFRH